MSESAPPSPEAEPTTPPDAPIAERPAPRWREIALVLFGTLLLVVALIATAPVWAPLLPWSGDRTRAEQEIAANVAGLSAALRQDQQQFSQRQAALDSTLQQLDSRVALLEAKPAASPQTIAGVRDDVAKLGRAAADLDARVAALDKTVRGRAAADGDLVARLDALDKSIHARAATDMGDTALLLDLLQIRAAVSAGRSFAAEYDVLVRLARGRPEIESAAAPLADAAKSGVATRSALADKLRGLGSAIAAKPSAAAANVTDTILARLGRLVTIRRIDNGAAQAIDDSGPAAAVAAADRALAGGDLDAAIKAIGKLTGTPAEAAAPWLRLAQQRLAAEAALRRIEAALSARIGSPGAAEPPG
ncbi:MAG TPA: hypothetical protein VJR70_11235 [Stellaceae bacterium]|nr:hypothetical protein [Stellaceae bacterium]